MGQFKGEDGYFFPGQFQVNLVIMDPWLVTNGQLLLFWLYTTLFVLLEYGLAIFRMTME